MTDQTSIKSISPLKKDQGIVIKQATHCQLQVCQTEYSSCMPKGETPPMGKSIENNWQNLALFKPGPKVFRESLPGFFTGCKKHLHKVRACKGVAPGRQKA
jgi:hypothetical protein